MGIGEDNYSSWCVVTRDYNTPSVVSLSTIHTSHYGNVPFEVPEGWVWCNITDVTNKITDGTHNSPVNTLKGDYMYVTAKNIRPSGIILDNITFVSKKVHEEIYSRCNPELGDILYIKDGATTGIVTINTLDEPFSLLSSVALIKPSHEISNRYILYYLQSSLCYSSVRETMKGVGITRITLKQIEKWHIPLPPFPEQQRIVSEIEKWFALIDQIEQSKSDLQTIIKQAKSKILDLAIHGKLIPQDPNDEPAIELLKRINPNFTPCDNGHSEKLPQSWCLSRLKELCSFLSRGKSPKYSDNDKTIPVFAQKCNLKEGGISLEQARFLDPFTICKWSEVYKLQTGDILVNSTGTGTVGRTRLFNKSYLGQYPFVLPDSHISVVRATVGIIPQYLYAYISSNKIQQYIEDNLAGSTNQKELYIGILEQMEIFVPPFLEQQRIVQKIEELFSVLDNIQNALEV